MYTGILITLALALALAAPAAAQPEIPENAWRDIYNNVSSPAQTISTICRAVWSCDESQYCGQSSPYMVGTRHPFNFCNRLYDSATIKIRRLSWDAARAKKQLQRYRWVQNYLRSKAYWQCWHAGRSNC